MIFKSERAARPSSSLQPIYEVPSFRQALPQLTTELRRARRYEHPLAVVVISTRDHAGEAQRADKDITPLPPAATTTHFLLLGAFLRNTIRETDLLTAAPEALSYAVFLTETDREGAEQAIVRFRDGFRGCAGVELRFGSAEFPRDGLTVEDLFGRASDAWNQNTTRRPSRRAGGLHD